MENRVELINKIRDYIAKMGLVVEKEIPEKEIFLVSSVELGLSAMIIDLEGDIVAFQVRLGKLKESATIRKGDLNIALAGDEADEQIELNAVDILGTLMQMNDALNFQMTTGQFGLTSDGTGTLTISEQQLLATLDYEEFEDVVNGIVATMTQKLKFLQSICE